jgi:PPM family protein phosphatase
MIKKRGSFAYRSDIGRVRPTNEDEALVLANESGNILMVVCDGIGGHNRGDLASKLAIEYLQKSFLEKTNFFTMATARLWLIYQVKQANRIVFQESQINAGAREMGTTLTAVLLVDNEIAVVNVGDSRAYIIRREGLVQITEDQSYVDYLYRTGKITKEQMKNHPQKHVLLNALGLSPTLSFDIQVHAYHEEPILVCTDGLHNNVSDKELYTVLTSTDTVNQKVDSLIRIANSNGGPDNIAIALWEPHR